MEKETKPQKIDKRKETSKANMQKARLKILEERRMAKQIQQNTYDIDDSDSDSSGSESGSDEPVIMIKGKGVKSKDALKEKPTEKENIKNELENLKQMILTMGNGKKKKDKKKKKQVIVLPPQQPAPMPQPTPQPKQDNSLEQAIRRKILNF
jgi:hypothetical protein